jgi:hypothetical protein
MGIRNLSSASAVTGAKKNKVWDQSTYVSRPGFDLIGRVTVGSTSMTSIVFSGIPQNYQSLQLRMILRSNLAANAYSAMMRLNSDSGSNYAYHILYGNGTSALATAGSSTNAPYLLYTQGTSTSNVFAADVVDILDAFNTSKYKTIRSLGGSDANGAGAISLSSALWQNTNAITSISISTNGYGDFVQYTTVALYGVK